MIVLDTTVLSLAFRRSTASSPVAERLQQLIEDDEPLAVPGIVLQEILSGIREPIRFAKMQEIMGGFPLLLAGKADHVAAARIANDCRRAGISTTTPDCLIAALSTRRNAELFTTDQDFAYMAEYSALRIFQTDRVN